VRLNIYVQIIYIILQLKSDLLFNTEKDQ